MIVVYLVRPLITMFKMCLCRSLDFLLFLYCFDVDEALFHIIAIFIDSFTRDRGNTYYASIHKLKIVAEHPVLEVRHSNFIFRAFSLSKLEPYHSTIPRNN